MSMSDQGGIVSRRVASGLVLVSALSALGFLALSAYAPDLRSNKSQGTDVLSKSAVGFAGLRILLEASQIDTQVGRDPRPDEVASLFILTPEFATDHKDLAPLAAGRERLVVLPKWLTLPDPLHAGWVSKIAAFDSATIAELVSDVAKGAKIRQRTGPAQVTLQGPYAHHLSIKRLAMDSPQTISGPTLDAALTDEKGHALLAQIRGTQTFILADPDLLNNAGLGNAATARAGLDLIKLLRVSNAPVVLDVTLNGFGRSRNVLKTVFSPPFLGATLCALLAAALLAYHAMNRFGAPLKPDRIYAFGKQIGRAHV